MLRHWRGVAHVVALALLACGSEKVTEAPGPADEEPAGSASAELLISAPIPRAALPGGADSSGSVVFVSAMPQAAPGAVQAVVQGANGQSATTSVLNGGFDPVRLGAVSGDVVTVTLTYGDGATTSEQLAVRARRPPRVVRTSPAPHRTDVPLNAVIRVVFSAPVDLESARAGVLLTTGAGDVVPGTVEASGVVAVEYVVTAGTLEPETTYRLEVTTGVQDLLGQALAEPVTVEFRTGTTRDPSLVPGALGLLVDPVRLILVRGGSGQGQVTITRGEVFTGAVALSASSPAGVTVTFSPARIEAGSTTATVNVVVDSAVAPGSKAVVIRAVGDGPRAAIATSTLIVAVVAGSVSLTLAPTRIEIVQGSTRSVEATIARGGTFTGGVSLTPSGARFGVRAAYGSIGEGSTTTTLDIWVDSTAAPGTRSVTIRATGVGIGAATATVDIAVIEPAGSVALTMPPTTVDVVRGGRPAYVEVAISRAGTFTGSVGLSVIDAPPGVYVSTPSIDAGSTTASLEVVIEPSATLGTKRIVISATGYEIRSASATLLIAAVDPSGAVTLVPEPDPLTVVAGAPAVTSTIAINRTGLTGPVDLTVTEVGGGVTATINPDVAAGATATLSISAPSGAVNGAYSLRIHGSGTDIADAFTTVWFTIAGGLPAFLTLDPTTVTVTAGGPSATSVLTRAATAPSGALTRVSELPTGLTASVDSSWMWSSTAPLTVQAGAAVAPGTYFLSVRMTWPFFNPGEGGRTLRSYAVQLRVVVSAAPALRR